MTCNTNRCRGAERRQRMVATAFVRGCRESHAVLACQGCGMRRLDTSRCQCPETPSLDQIQFLHPNPMPHQLRRKLNYRPRVRARRSTARRRQRERADWVRHGYQGS